MVWQSINVFLLVLFEFYVLWGTVLNTSQCKNEEMLKVRCHTDSNKHKSYMYDFMMI